MKNTDSHSAGRLKQLWNRVAFKMVDITAFRTGKVKRAMEARGWEFKEIPLEDPYLSFPGAIGGLATEDIKSPDGTHMSAHDDAYKKALKRTAAKVYGINGPA